MTLIDLMSHFSDEDCCRDLLERLRWPIAPKCIRCQGDVSRRGAILICYACHYEFRVTTGTIFGDTKLPLETWFLAVLLLCEAFADAENRLENFKKAHAINGRKLAEEALGETTEESDED